jgi:CRISPR-associated protein Csb2
MSSRFCVSVTFLNHSFHGRADRGVPEWPPSPLRLFQSMVASLGLEQRLNETREALHWLECLRPPEIVAPSVVMSAGYRLSLPNNSMDLVTRARARGGQPTSDDANPSKHRTMKTARSVRFAKTEEFPVAHYIWDVGSSAETERYTGVLSRAARKIVALGWGVDMAIGYARMLSKEHAEHLKGERWRADGGDGPVRLRVPVDGTLSALEERYEQWLRRITESGTNLSPGETPKGFASVAYSREIDPLPPMYAAFSCRHPGSGAFRVFSTPEKVSAVAGMARHAARLAAERAGWSADKVARFVLGHGEPPGAERHASVGAERFAYLPIPTIEWRPSNSQTVGDIRRLLILVPARGHDNEVAWAQRKLSGQDLVSERSKEVQAVLAPIMGADNVLASYTRRSESWTTVTPVVLPGYDDPRHYRRRLGSGASGADGKRLIELLDRRIDALLRKAICQAGFSKGLAKHAVLEWRSVGFLPGTQRADRYVLPKHLSRFPRLHVRIHWRDEDGKPTEVAGPICIGGGRFIGMGLFVALPSTA